MLLIFNSFVKVQCTEIKQDAIKPKGFNDYARKAITFPKENTLKVIYTKRAKIRFSKQPTRSLF